MEKNIIMKAEEMYAVACRVTSTKNFLKELESHMIYQAEHGGFKYQVSAKLIRKVVYDERIIPEVFKNTIKYLEDLGYNVKPTFKDDELSPNHDFTVSWH